MSIDPHRQQDASNAALLIHLNGELVPRERALVSIFDAGFVLGDGVWEGIRVFNRRAAFLDEHLDRLFEGAAAIDLDPGIDRSEFIRRIQECIEANELRAGAHLRLMLTRGEKSVPFQHPKLAIGAPTIAIVAQYMPDNPQLQRQGLRLATVHVRRGRPDVQDPKLNSHSKLNCVTACIAADKAGADEALMLDPQGFVATCNSTHFFIVRRGEVWTSTGDYCLGGITRGKVLHLCRANGIVSREKNFSLTEVYGADEAFTTGTLAGLVPVSEVDGRALPTHGAGEITARLQMLYREMIREECGGLE
jgi:branched-chain amino acid aminotransferase